MMQVFQRTPVHIHEYPFAERLNPKLHDIILEKAVNRDFGATMTSRMSWKECFDIKEFRTIADWVYKIILGFNFSYDGIFDLKLRNLWGQYYKKGDYQITHAHNPLSWSFVYYVNAPKGSAPLVFETTGTKIRPEEGKVIIFPSIMRHGVPKNNCKDRLTLVGNIPYILLNANQI